MVDGTSLPGPGPSEFDARSEANAHRAEVLLPYRRTLLIASVAMIGFGGAFLAFELYHISTSGLPVSNQVLSVVPPLGACVALVAVGIYLLSECPGLKRTLPTTYLFDPDGFTARWDNGTTVRTSWNDPKLRLFMRDMRDQLHVQGCATLISRAGSVVPFAVPSEFYDRVLSEATKRGLVTKASYFRARAGLMVHTATIRGRKLR
jgi:hypothetical protein